MKICIPSKNRASTIKTHLFFKPEDVLIFVEPEEVKRYQIFCPNYKIISIEKSDMGVSYARNYILDHVNEKYIIMADDDYEKFGKRNSEGRYSELSNCQEIIDTIQKGLEEDRYIGYSIGDDLFGYYINVHSQNKKRLFINKKVLMDFYGLNLDWLKENKVRYDENLKEGEDTDLTIQILINKGKTCVDYLYSRSKKFKNEGGLSKERGILYASKDLCVRRYIEYLTKKYGTEFISSTHDKQGYLKSKTVKFDLILKRLDIIKKNIEEFKKTEDKVSNQ